MANPAGKHNPADSVDEKLAGKHRIPMSVPTRHLEVEDIPGYHSHWFATRNVKRALRAGYTFVTLEDGVDINNFDLAGDASSNGSSDLGTNLSIPAAVGGDSEERLYLMKLPLEFWEEDQKLLEERNEVIARSLRGGQSVGEQIPGDPSQQYIPPGMKQTMANLFTPKRKR